MDVKAIDNRTQFSGRVDRSVVKYINKRVYNACFDRMEQNVRDKKLPVSDAINQIEQQGRDILNKLKAVMANTHKDSVLKISNVYFDNKSGDKATRGIDLVITNPVARKKILVASSNREGVPFISYSNKSESSLNGLEQEVLPVIENMGSEGINAKFISLFEEDLPEILSKVQPSRIFLHKVHKKLGKLLKYVSEIPNDPLYLEKVESAQDAVNKIFKKGYKCE